MLKSRAAINSIHISFTSGRKSSLEKPANPVAAAAAEGCRPRRRQGYLMFEGGGKKGSRTLFCNINPVFFRRTCGFMVLWQLVGVIACTFFFSGVWEVKGFRNQARFGSENVKNCNDSEVRQECY